MRENHVKTISLGEGLRYDLSCTPRAFEIRAKLFSGTLGKRNDIYLKTFWYGPCENACFHGNPLYDLTYTLLKIRITNIKEVI